MPQPKTYPFDRSCRIRKSPEFAKVYESGLYAADHMLVINAARNEHNHSRLGLSISRRVGNAVQRNRWKRALRESFRTQQAQLPKGWDWVIRPRKGAQPDAEQIRSSLKRLVNRIARKQESSHSRQSSRPQPTNAKGHRAKGNRDS